MNASTNNTPVQSLEQLISIFGQEVGTTMFNNMNADSAGSAARAPFTFIKKISQMGSELGEWGSFVINAKFEKNDAGERVIADKGFNLGKNFEFIIVTTNYYYSRWNESTSRTETSNIFSTLSGIKTAVDSYKGTPLPADKEAKKAAGWKMVKQLGVLVKADGKWEQAILEVSGMMYFTLGQVLDNKPNNGVLSGVVDFKTLVKTKGATSFVVCDEKASTFNPLPSDLFTDKEVTTKLSEITTKMGEYRDAKQYTAGASEETPSSAPKQEESEDELGW